MLNISQVVLDENNIAFNPMMENSYQLNNFGKEITTLICEGKTKDEVVDFLLFSIK